MQRDPQIGIGAGVLGFEHPCFRLDELPESARVGFGHHDHRAGLAGNRVAQAASVQRGQPQVELLRCKVQQAIEQLVRIAAAQVDIHTRMSTR